MRRVDARMLESLRMGGLAGLTLDWPWLLRDRCREDYLTVPGSWLAILRVPLRTCV